MSFNPLLLNNLVSKPHTEQEAALREIRLSIIGDEDEKLILLNSQDFIQIFKLFDQFVNGETKDTQVLQHLLVIISSLVYFPPALPKLINQHNIVIKLMIISNQFANDNTILSIIFKLLSNILSLKHDLNLELNSPDGVLFRNLILSKLEINNTDNYKLIKENELLYNIFTLIPHLNPLVLKNLIQPIMRILEIVLNKPTNYLYSKYGGKNYYIDCFNSLILPNSPPLVLFSNLTGPLLYSLAHLLYYDQESSMRTFSSSNHNDDDKLFDIENLNKINQINYKNFNKNLYFTITSLLKSNDYELKLSAISLLINFSINSTLSDLEKNKNVRKFLPYLIQLIDLDDSNNLIVFKSELKLSRRFNPFYILSKLCLNFEFVNDYLLNCNIIKNFCEIITKFKKMDFNSLTLLKLDNLSDLFLILSSITSNNEQNRNLIVKHDLSETIHKILEFHYSNLKKYLKKHSKDNQQLDDSKDLDQILIASNNLTISTCYLLRSLSRSVSILRSYLYETNIVDNLLNILKISEDSLINIDEKNHVINKSEILLKTIILSIISNLVLDFSPLRNDLLNNNLIEIVSNLLLTTNHNQIKINCLWVIRHIIYNETSVIRDKSIEKIGIKTILKLCNDEDSTIQEQAFNVLRNLTCSSKFHVNKILNTFASENQGFDFFQFIYEKLSTIPMSNLKNEGLIESIIFIIVHIAAISEVKRELIIKNTQLLNKIRELLQYYESNEVKLSCIWLVINLTWMENISNQQPPPLQNQQQSIQTNNFFEDEDIMDEDEEEFEDGGDEEGDTDPTNSRLRSQLNINPSRNLNRRNNIPGSITENFIDSNNNFNNLDQNPSKRAGILNEIGFTKILTDLLDTENIDLKERVRTALFNLTNAVKPEDN
ncbi:Armadillo repeat-containing protein 8 [Wickerhamomyces ciferrii]|uniref:Armadillo repeat-containing protein 8 n=1 Tax=Wickerhamomyces ciferrii (strain ATCC 14091 / BCRC 22168 / CBS 111 / JCM 3599 / NBRC 0793 / NRRL Y-1031 F-60-10) TaxID=1206466 RepID=K0KXX4_WICCF|nr:Armadillo repeat-containing protein 8 [Wickerhamomyces ciferrii]CCH45933.1 Armadillo repeat-containing protein 8 [Wickerhamomyces ciferrii]